MFEKFEKKDNIKQKISLLKFKLQQTDYAAIKYAEGELTLAEYAPVKEQRREWRAEINRLQEELQAELNK